VSLQSIIKAKRSRAVKTLEAKLKITDNEAEKRAMKWERELGTQPKRVRIIVADDSRFLLKEDQ
jgi:hypothetical protein